MRDMIAKELIRIAEGLTTDADLVISEVGKDDAMSIRKFCAELQAEMDRIRQNEGVDTFMSREDTLDGVRISIGVSDHEAKDAIIEHLKKKMGQLCKGMGVKVGFLKSPALRR